MTIAAAPSPAPETSGREAPGAFSLAGDILWRSAPRRIGKHEWRVTVYRLASGRAVLGYEWRRAAETISGFAFPPGPRWQRDVDWPKYDRHDGQYAGLPRTLLKLYQEHRADLSRHLRRPAA